MRDVDRRIPGAVRQRLRWENALQLGRHEPLPLRRLHVGRAVVLGAGAVLGRLRALDDQLGHIPALRGLRAGHAESQAQGAVFLVQLRGQSCRRLRADGGCQRGDGTGSLWRRHCRQQGAHRLDFLGRQRGDVAAAPLAGTRGHRKPLGQALGQALHAADIQRRELGRVGAALEICPQRVGADVGLSAAQYLLDLVLAPGQVRAIALLGDLRVDGVQLRALLGQRLRGQAAVLAGLPGNGHDTALERCAGRLLHDLIHVGRIQRQALVGHALEGLEHGLGTLEVRFGFPLCCLRRQFCLLVKPKFSGLHPLHQRGAALRVHVGHGADSLAGQIKGLSVVARGGDEFIRLRVVHLFLERMHFLGDLLGRPAGPGPGRRHRLGPLVDGSRHVGPGKPLHLLAVRHQPGVCLGLVALPDGVLQGVGQPPGQAPHLRGDQRRHLRRELAHRVADDLVAALGPCLARVGLGDLAGRDTGPDLVAQVGKPVLDVGGGVQRCDLLGPARLLVSLALGILARLLFAPAFLGLLLRLAALGNGDLFVLAVLADVECRVAQVLQGLRHAAVDAACRGRAPGLRYCLPEVAKRDARHGQSSIALAK